MNQDYNYSIYSNLRVIFLQDNSSRAGTFHNHSIRYHTSIEVEILDSQFLYSQQDTNCLRFGELTVQHFLNYPSERQYTFVNDFLKQLYQIYKIHKGEMIENSLYKAIRKYLSLVKSKSTNNLPATQYVFVIPIKYSRDEKFLQGFRTLLIEAQWVLDTDPKSKLLLFGEFEAAIYAQQYYAAQKPRCSGVAQIERERKYLSCLILKNIQQNSVEIQIDLLRMKYDKEFIAASRSSISSSDNQLLAPYFLSPSLKTTISVLNLEKILELPKFIISRVFRKPLGQLSSMYDDDYSVYLDGGRCLSGYFIKHLVQTILLRMTVNDQITDLSKSIKELILLKLMQDLGSRECIGRILLDDVVFKDQLTEIEINNLSSIRYDEILKYIPKEEGINILLHNIQSYSRDNMLILDSITDTLIIIANYTYNGGGNDLIMIDMYFAYLQIKIKNAIYSLLREKETPYPSQILENNVCMNGILFKILTFVELSNKLEMPAILPSKNKQQIKPIDLKYADKIQAIISKIPGYGFYVEAKIISDHQIKFYLHQVIETKNTAVYETEKSTLPMFSKCIQIQDMYESICYNIWNASQGQAELNCTLHTEKCHHFSNFKSRLYLYLDKILNDDLSNQYDLYTLKKIRVGDHRCLSEIAISHQTICAGIKSYLNDIATAVVGALKSQAIFGEYRTWFIFLTGSLLSQWLSIKNSLYKHFIWKQFDEELVMLLDQHQIKTKLSLSLDYIKMFSDEKLIKLEKYQQVLGQKSAILEVERLRTPGKLYEAKGDRYEIIPSFTNGEKEYWRVNIAPDNDTVMTYSGITRMFILKSDKEYTPKFEKAEDFDLDYRLRISVYDTGIEQDPINRNSENSVITGYLAIRRQISEQDELTTTFPLAVTLMPQNNAFKTKIFFEYDYSHEEGSTALLTARMALVEKS